MKQLIAFLFFASILILGSCRKDFDTVPNTGTLEFSKDTVYLDAIFTGISSSTYTLKVYNRSDDDITIPSIELENGMESDFRLSVDGVPGRMFEDVNLLAKDSLYIFIETTSDFEGLDDLFLYTDRILFDNGDQQQDVDLITLVQDAYFLFPGKTDGIIETLYMGEDADGEEIRLEGRYLEDSELTFTNEKPYIIYGFMKVGSETDAAKTLIVEAGAKVHFHANSGLIIGDNSSLHILGAKNIAGAPETEVVFEGDRLEPEYADVSGQWGYIRLSNGSENNIINYATIKNATYGIISIGQTSALPTLEINNSKIFNHTNHGLLALATSVNATNLVINNVGLSAFFNLYGGAYNFTHCTLANYNTGRNNQYPVVYLQNFYTPDNEPTEYNHLYEANFTNSIIYGNQNIEIALAPSDDATYSFNYKFTNCLLRFNDTYNDYIDNPLFDFDNTSIFENNILNESADFRNSSLNDMIIGSDSACINAALPSASALVPLDIMGVDRTVSAPADIGAYESVIFEE